MTGNWEFTATPTTGAAPFTALAGFVNEEATDTSIDDFTTAALQATSTTCFHDPPNISLQGAALGHQLNLGSFLTNYQTVTITGTKPEAANTLTGTYTVTGGCADGEAGTIAGTLYNPLTGTYGGPVTSSPTETITLNMAQNAQGDGDGKSFLSGTAVFQGFPCGLASETLLTPDSYVLGSAVFLAVNDSTGPQFVASGTFDSAASTIMLTSIKASNANTNCSESVGPAVLAN